MLKMAIVHPHLWVKGGAERVVLKIAQHYDAPIWCSAYNPDETFAEFRDLEINVLDTKFKLLLPHALPLRMRAAAIAGWEFYNLKLPDQFDLVNAQGTPSEWTRHRNAPVLWYCHTPNREAFDLYRWRMSRRTLTQRIPYWVWIQIFKNIEFSVVPKIERILVNSANSQARIKHYLNRDAEVLSPGVDTKVYGCKRYERFFFYPSRIAPEKRFELAISAFKEFKKHAKGPWRLVIAGSLMRSRPDHVAYYEKIKKMLGSNGTIMLDISEAKLRDLYARCWTVLYAPVNEDFGIVPLEAGASNKPCIAVDEGGPREVVVNGKTGFLINTEKEMAAKMLWLAERPEAVEQLGKAARTRIKSNFSWERFFERFDQVTKEVASMQAGRSR